MKDYEKLLETWTATGQLRRLPDIRHADGQIKKGEEWLLNLSSNDYLGLACRNDLREAFRQERPANGQCRACDLPFSSSSSRLLTGNFQIYTQLEMLLADRFEREAALVFNSGYHANTGILPALADKQTLILADKWVHASLIDGIRLSGAPFSRYKHNDYEQLERILAKEAAAYQQVIVVTESIFSMDGDTADLPRLTALKKQFPNLLLYVDEAHAIGVRGSTGLGLAEEAQCIQEIDLLVGTFGKALASMGAYVICNRVIRNYLVNTMRPLIFSTALPPIQIAWTKFLFERLPGFSAERERVAVAGRLLRQGLAGRGGEISDSHIVPYILGSNEACIETAEQLQRKGFYCLPVRPPTVPKGTSRIRFSLTADTTGAQIQNLLRAIDGFSGTGSISATSATPAASQASTAPASPGIFPTKKQTHANR